MQKILILKFYFLGKNITCDHVTGEYSCRPGYVGPMCQHPCPKDTYGLNCKQSCECKNGDCHHVTGDYSTGYHFIEQTIDRNYF